MVDKEGGIVEAEEQFSDEDTPEGEESDSKGSGDITDMLIDAGLDAGAEFLRSLRRSRQESRESTSED